MVGRVRKLVWQDKSNWRGVSLGIETACRPNEMQWKYSHRVITRESGDHPH